MKQNNKIKENIDRKEHLLNNEALEKYNKQLHNKLVNTRKKRSHSCGHDGLIVIRIENDGGIQPA